MDIRRFADMLEGEFWQWGTLNAYPRNAECYCRVLDDVQGMTTPSNMHLINLGVQCLEPGEHYLEVGTWRGATFIGALLNNDALGIAIDDDSMNEHDKDERDSQSVWWENIRAFDLAERAAYVNGRVPELWTDMKMPPIGVYLFDGDKATEDAAYDGIAGIAPFLANEALIFVDDANDINVRRAVWRFERDYLGHAIKILDVPTPGNCWPCFWNGVIAIAWHT